MKSLIDSNRPLTNTIQSLRIGLASPDKIITWSNGEVKKPETFNYRTYKPEKDGLFCERIFGPVKDYECACGKYKKKRYKGIVCERCGVEVASNRVRRERLGHIRLASPVAHIWFTKSIPNRFSALLGISGKEIEKVVYFVSWLVTEVDTKWVTTKLPEVQHLVGNFLQELEQEKRELRNLETLNLFEQAKEGDIDPSRKREITMLAKALDGNAPEADDEKTQEKIEGIKELLLSQELLKPYMAAERVLDPATNEVVACIQDRFNFALLSKLFYLGLFEIVVENVQLEIEATKRIEEIELASAALSRALELISNIQPLDRLNDQQHEDYNALRSVCLMRDMGDLDEHFRIAIGANAVKECMRNIDLAALETELLTEMEGATSQKKQKVIKRLKVVRAFISSGNKPEWMILDVLPVLPPELRPMVELEGGRFASSDLNDLYRRVINRNNRLKKLIDIRAPESILRNERRMLQEAVDALIDNGRKGRAAVNVNNRALKSLSDMLKGKQGRFRQNLLGKRVDYSGRSVVVVGPRLRLHQCGLPKYMALELFKPFVLNKLINPDDPNQNIAQARRTLERAEDPKVWDALEEITRNHPVLLNRAPTLHRLSIQAFEPVLIEGKAIQLHPLVCAAYNADFDGDQMAVHIPLSTAAQAEARLLMLSAHNLLLPADGKPIISPTHDVVLGVYYMTQMGADEIDPSRTPAFLSINDALVAYQHGHIKLQDPVRVPLDTPVINSCDFSERPKRYPGLVVTTPGRMIINEQLRDVMREHFDDPLDYPLPYINSVMDKGGLVATIAEAFQVGGQAFTVGLADILKDLGFEMATVSGLTISASDIVIPKEKTEIIGHADREAEDIWSKRRKGIITEIEKDMEVTRIWDQATKDLTKAMRDNFDRFNSLYMMAMSGARGKMDQVRQLAAMRGLLVGPSGRVLDFPIKSNFREGLSVFEYFISTHGGRKGLVDTALKTADSGYLTRRLIDVALDVSVSEHDCHSDEGITLPDPLTPGPFTDPTTATWIKKAVAMAASKDKSALHAKTTAIARSLRKRTFLRTFPAYFAGLSDLQQKLSEALHAESSAISKLAKAADGTNQKADDYESEANLARIALQNALLAVAKLADPIKKTTADFLKPMDATQEALAKYLKGLPKALASFNSTKDAVLDSVDHLGHDAKRYLASTTHELAGLLEKSRDSEDGAAKPNALSAKEYEAHKKTINKEILAKLVSAKEQVSGLLETVDDLKKKAKIQREKSTSQRAETSGRLQKLLSQSKIHTSRLETLAQVVELPMEKALEMRFEAMTAPAPAEEIPTGDLAQFADSLIQKIRANLQRADTLEKQLKQWNVEWQSNARRLEEELELRSLPEAVMIDDWLEAEEVSRSPKNLARPYEKSYLGRVLAKDFVADFGDGPEVVLPAGHELDRDDCRILFIASLLATLVSGFGSCPTIVRSVLTCKTLGGVCAKCYGWDLAAGRGSQVGDPIGVVAAQSIGEPGTQLTMRTFHTGGIKGRDITQGLPQVETLFEVRGVKNPSVLAEQDGEIVAITEMVYDRVAIQSTDGEREKTYEVVHPYDERLHVHYRSTVAKGDALDRAETIFAEFAGVVTQLFTDSHKTYWKITIRNQDSTEMVYETPHENRRPLVVRGQFINRGEQLCEGDMDLRRLHTLLGDLPTQLYITNKIQQIYESQNVNTNSKHIEVVTKQMIRFVEIIEPDIEAELYEGDLVDRNYFYQLVDHRLAEGKQPPQGRSLLQGISKSSLSTESFLAAASFQETTRVLTEAAIEGKVDELRGLKENVIIGGLIPVGTGRLMQQIEEHAAESLFPKAMAEVEEDKPAQSIF